MKDNTKIILVSKSPRKQLLLNCICSIPFKTVNIDCKEIKPKHINDIENTLKLNALTKILTYIEKENVMDNQILLASDTLVCIPDKNIILGKINNNNKKIFKKLSEEQLYFLLGKGQVVYTSIAVFNLNNYKFYSGCAKTILIFNKKTKETEELINYYVELKGDRGPYGKAGGYGLQEPEILILTKEVIGDPGVVIGFPIYKTYELLKECSLKNELIKINLNDIYKKIWGSSIWKNQDYYIPESLKMDKNILKGNFVPMAFKKIHIK